MDDFLWFLGVIFTLVLLVAVSFIVIKAVKFIWYF